jgi:hypothetical protein
MGAVVETGAQTIIRQMKDLGMLAPKVSFMGTRWPLRAGVAQGGNL